MVRSNGVGHILPTMALQHWIYLFCLYNCHAQTSLKSSKTGQEDPCGSALMRGQQAHWQVQYHFRSGNAKDFLHLTCKRGSVGQSEGLLTPRSSVRFRLNPENRDSSSNGIELRRPSIKGTKLLSKVIKTIIISGSSTSLAQVRVLHRGFSFPFC